ncbi:MAG: hypothetical protein GXP14_03860 [Gammaproteobacteria bacterium]|nr:hypothetical protein [Gammaproteobacteria bacterium]
MIETEKDSLGESIYYEDARPIKCTVIEAEPEAMQRFRYETMNDDVLTVIASLDEMPLDNNDESLNSADLQRIEYKLNLTLELVSQLFAQQFSLPEPVDLRLNAERLAWKSEVLQPENALVSISLYLNDRYPKPIQLFGHTVTSTESEFQNHVILLPMKLAVQDKLDKFIFRQHRRFIAHRRRGI